MQLVIGDDEGDPARAQELRQLVSFWVDEMQSIPSLLAELTKNYFELTEAGRKLVAGGGGGGAGGWDDE